MRIETRKDLQTLREEALQEIQACDCRILVCAGTGCIATGSQKIYERLMEIAKDAPGVSVEFKPCGDETHVGVKKTGCQGICELGPLVRIQKGDRTIQYIKVQEEDCEEIFQRSVLGEEALEHLLYQQKGKVYRTPDEIPFIAKQTRVVLENCGRFDAESLEEYIAAGGFSALEKALFEMTPEDVVEVVDQSGLRGRGGGGFPAGQIMRCDSDSGKKLIKSMVLRTADRQGMC